MNQLAWYGWVWFALALWADLKLLLEFVAYCSALAGGHKAKLPGGGLDLIAPVVTTAVFLYFLLS